MENNDSISLTRLLNNRRWWWRTEPFPFLYARDVFIDSFYQELEQAFKSYLDPEAKRFARNMPGYDATGMVFTPDMEGPYNIFISRPFHDMIAEIFEVNATCDIVGSLHHHEPGGTSGRIHNDLNPGWFGMNPRSDGVNVHDGSLCNYHNGFTSRTGVKTHETVRAVAVLFYVNNPPWSPGDGGETGFYADLTDPVEKPAAAIPPLNNSIVCFECTPYSYHSFIKNQRNQRNSVTMWLHRTKKEVVDRWGEDKIVYWTR